MSVAGLILLAAFFLNPFVAAAQQIFKWQDEKGQWHFSQGPGRGPVPVVRVAVERIDYRNLYLTIEGVVENVSNFGIQSPQIKIRVYDSENELLFADSSSYPAGYGAKIEPRKSAVFKDFISLPEKARGREVRLDISVENLPFDIDWKREGRLRIW